MYNLALLYKAMHSYISLIGWSIAVPSDIFSHTPIYNLALLYEAVHSYISPIRWPIAVPSDSGLSSGQHSH